MLIHGEEMTFAVTMNWIKRGMSTGTLVLLVMAMTWAGKAQSQETPDRITASLDESRRVVLAGNVHPLARAEFDRGVAPEGLPMDRMLLLLQRSPEQNVALETLLAEQLDPSSANYHAWLSPQQFGRQFGVSQSDMDRTIQWLSSHGFAIGEVSNSRMAVEFSGNASQVRQAFHTEIHKYVVNGEEHWANATDPQIPAALAQVVGGVVSLHDFGPRAMHTRFGPVRKTANSSAVKPLFDVPYNGTEYYGFSPYDFATMYNITPLWNAGVTGAGQTIAIPGQSDIRAADVAAFRKAFGLPVNAPQIIVNGADPGTITGDEEESDLDVEWSGAVAKNATIKFVTSATTSSTAGVTLSSQYIVDKKIASILSLSYGECEEGLGTAGNQFWNALWQQAAGEGITVFIAAGDSGSAGCDQHGQAAPSAAQYGLQVNGLASTPYDVAVGGTDLADYNPVGSTNTFATYWATSNSSTTGASLKKYVPEVVWNDSCTILNEAACNNSANTSFVVIAGGSGGKSGCTVVNATTGACSGGYVKPSWQTGTGVPADGKRDLPDVSLFAGDGERGSFFLICDSNASPDGTCNYANSTDAISLAVGGTSGSSPAMAGIQALVNQKQNATQGNINPKLYSLAAKETLSGCNSTNGSGSTCVFNDVTAGTNAMPCYSGTTNCKATTAGDTYSILPGYNAGTGYDLASGLGSVNAYNLATQWAGTAAAPKVTLSVTTVAFGNQGKGTISAARTVTLTNSGTAALTAVSITLAGTNPTDFAESNNCGTSVAVNASCTITLLFKPAATAGYAATVSIKDNAAGSPQSITLTGTGVTPAPAVTLSATSVVFGNVAKGTASPVRLVTLTNSGSAVLTGVSIALGGVNPTDFTESNKCPASIAAHASCTITLEFKPATVANYTAAVSIKDNAVGSPQSIALSGSGVNPAPTATLSATSVAFGSQVFATTSAAKTVTLTNKGNLILTGVTIALGGINPADFVESNNCGTSVAVNATCTITLEFKPAAVATYSATVSIKDNATGSPQSIALTGTGIKSTLTGTIIDYAGDGISGYSGDNGPAVKAHLYYGQGTAADANGNLYIADEGNNVIRKVNVATGVISTYAGNGYGAGKIPGGYTGDGGPATKAELGGPFGVALDKAGNLFIADTYNSVIRKVSATTGIITTVAGNGTFGYSGDGGLATQAELAWPKSVAVDTAGNIYISDSSNQVIRKVTVATGKISTIAGGGNGCTAETDVYGDGCPAIYANFEVPGYGTGTGGIAVDAKGNVFIADPDVETVREIQASNGIIKVVAGNGYRDSQGAGGFSGDGGPATSAELNNPRDVKVDGAGNIFISDASNNVIREVNAATGKINTIAGIYYASGGGKMVSPATSPTAVKFATPAYISIDPSGNLFISDVNNFMVDKVYGAAAATPVN